MKMYNMNKYCGLAALISAFALASSTNAAVFDFEGGVPVYDANRAQSASADVNVDANLASSATVMFAWDNTSWDGKTYTYSWNGIGVSNANDLSADPSYPIYAAAGERAQYTSVTGTDASSISGGTYGIWYGYSANPNTWASYNGYSKTEMGYLYFTEMCNFDSISVANTLVTQNYLEANVAESKNCLYEVIVYGIASSDGSRLTDNSVVIKLCDSIDGVRTSWVSGDLSSLNIAGGLYGLAFETYTDDVSEYGAYANPPSFFALDNIGYTVVPEPAFAGAILGLVVFAFAGLRRRVK